MGLTCSNLPGWVWGLPGGGVHVTTAAPWPFSAALQTERAWPGVGEQQTSEELVPAALEDTPLRRAIKKKKEKKKKEFRCCFGWMTRTVNCKSSKITHQTAGGATSHGREGGQRVTGWGWGHQERGIGPDVVQMTEGPPGGEGLNLCKGKTTVHPRATAGQIHHQTLMTWS